MLSPGDLPGVADGIDNAAQQLGQAPQLDPKPGFAATGYRESRALSERLKLVDKYLTQWHDQVVDTVKYRAALLDLAGKWFAQHEDASVADIQKLAAQALKQSSAGAPGRPANPPAH
jgi:hypothetical protein